MLFSSHFLPALQRPNVEVVAERDHRRRRDRRRSPPTGPHHEVDCIIYGTGFQTNDFMFPMEVTGAGGRSLRETWADGAHAHLGIVVPGFPSMFLMYGPNTNTSGGSIIVFEEAQAGYIRQALQQVRDHGAAAIDVRPEVEAASDRAVQARFAGTAWTRCDSWYRDDERPDRRQLAGLHARVRAASAGARPVRLRLSASALIQSSAPVRG